MDDPGWRQANPSRSARRASSSRHCCCRRGVWCLGLRAKSAASRASSSYQRASSASSSSPWRPQSAGHLIEPGCPPAAGGIAQQLGIGPFGTVGLLDAPVLYQPEAVATALDQLPVVGDQQHTPGRWQWRRPAPPCPPDPGDWWVRRARSCGGCRGTGRGTATVPARPAQGVHLLAVADIGEARPDQRLSPRHLRQRARGTARRSGVASSASCCRD